MQSSSLSVIGGERNYVSKGKGFDIILAGLLKVEKVAIFVFFQFSVLSK